MGLFETLNRLGVLGAGRRPEWRAQASTDGPPPALSAGVALGGAMKTLVHVALRDVAHYQSARVTLEYEAGATYTVTINGEAVVQSADTDTATTLAALADAINANVTLDGVVEASISGGVLVVRDVADAPFTISVSNTPVAVDDMTVEVDATSCTARVWLLPGGINNTDRPATWVVAGQGEFTLDHRGLMERLDTAGIDRLYVEIADADGVVRVAVGPGVLE